MNVIEKFRTKIKRVIIEEAKKIWKAFKTFLPLKSFTCEMEKVSYRNKITLVKERKARRWGGDVLKNYNWQIC